MNIDRPILSYKPKIAAMPGLLLTKQLNMKSYIIKYNQYVAYVKKMLSGLLRRAGRYLQSLASLLRLAGLLLPAGAGAAEREWSMGVYSGQYYDTEPAAFYRVKTDYLNHYIVAVTASKTLWRAESWPFAIELDGMMGYQFGLATLQEVAVAPVARWYGFPWNHYLQTDVRFGPIGISYTSIVSPIERGPNGDGSHFLNFLLFELGFSLPEKKEHEMFIRLHHRCSGYDTINNFGANGEDFFALGYRQYFE